ncbi:cutinase family protein [Nocardia gipuzkoensis]|uniref:cutinase family protein n=1 Tax=Nocardia gipuzkoensis TaxID=2749991 RepID=UPI00237E6163|nr:cutinase family protein [Nocardia gipuzkoensis]MDE1672642.1 cutinase family protein [Nocardia gipuzkoensis]
MHATTRPGMLAWITATAVTVATLVCGSAAAAPLQLPALGVTTDCPSVAGIFVPGTWETDAGADPTQPRGLLAPIATDLARQFGRQFDAMFPAYAARAMDGMLYGDSQTQGLAAAKAAVADIAARCRATKFIISGYSQGADVAGDLTAAIGCHQDPIPAARVLAVGLVADPKQGTSGGKLVGPQVQGTGIRGPRPEGFCQLSAVTAQLCEPSDRYCATDAAANPILAGLGRVLSQPSANPSVADPADASLALTQSLDAGFSARELTGLPGQIATIVDQIRSGHLTDSLASAATSAHSVLAELGELNSWISRTPAAQQHISAAATGTPEHAAAQLLATLQKLDLGAAADAASAISQQVTTTGASESSGGGLAQSAQALAAATSPLASTPTDVLSQASSVLSFLKPSTLIGQISDVASNTLTFAANTPKILDTLRQIAAAVTDPNPDLGAKVRSVHGIFGALNELCQPLVRMAAGVDLRAVAGLLRVIPDPNGITQLASVVVGLLANLDVVGLARQVGTLQENVWHILETLTGGGDLLAIGAAFANLIPTLAGFATTALGALTGAVSKTSPELLNAPVSLTGGASNLAGLVDMLARTATSKGADNLAQLLVNDGVTAAQFYNSGAHQSYDSYVVDSSGRTALTWLANWFANRIRQVGV